MRAEIQNITEAVQKSLALLAQRMDWETAEHRLEEFNAMSEDPDLWNDPTKAQKLMRERQMLVDAMDRYTGMKQELSDNVELIELGEMEEDGEVVGEAEAALNAILAAIEAEEAQPNEVIEDPGFALTSANIGAREMDMWGCVLLSEGFLDR